MSILSFGVFFIVSLMLGYFLYKKNWKLRYLAPICFAFVFLSAWILLSLLFYLDGRDVQFVLDGRLSLNSRAIDLIFAASTLSLLSTLLLITIVWAIRNDVF
ncbi:hypothetical protein F889_00701 [Acinetobacter colistiniresistens]|uniref:Uncharacterized protein n=1 Tax=Acinetobacter colistiniresistens TaxID=280145 RepID=N9RA63_9GAMM|nr:hypothetical protein F889_00701 [Acinetobacter colistiniresistens]